MPGTGDQRCVADRVGQFLTGDGEFRRARHELRRDRIVVVIGIDQRRHVLGHSDRKLLRHPPDLIEALGLDQSGSKKVFFTERDGHFAVCSNNVVELLRRPENKVRRVSSPPASCGEFLDILAVCMHVVDAHGALRKRDGWLSPVGLSAARSSAHGRLRVGPSKRRKERQETRP